MLIRSAYRLALLCTVVTGLLSQAPATNGQDLLAPTELQAQSSAPGDLAISLFWIDNAFGEEGFEIQRRIGDETNPFETIDVVLLENIGSYNDVNLQENTTYSYRVRAVFGVQASDFSNISSATTSYARPNQVADLQGVLVSGDVELSWLDMADNETRFEVERAEVGVSSAFETIAVLEPNTLDYIDETALAGTSYIYRIVPYRFDVQGGAPDTVTIETGVGTVAPRSITVKGRSRREIEVSWTWSTKPRRSWQVQVQRLDINSGMWIDLGKVAADRRRYRDGGLERSTSYTYRIRTVTPSAVSPWIQGSGSTR